MIGLNDKALEFVKLILNSDMSRQTKEEIVRFYSLPRNTAVKPALEVIGTDDVGSVDRPTADDIEYSKDKRKQEEDREMEKLLKEDE